MFDPAINIIIIALWLVAAIVDYAEYLYYWQLKWYMWSRYKDFLSTKQGNDFIFRKSFLLRAILAALVYFVSLDNVPLLKHILIGFFIADIVYLFGYRYIKKKFRRPVLTVKALIILGISLAVEVAIIVVIRNWHIIIILLIVRMFIVGCAAIFMNEFTTQIKNHYYSRRAEKKLKKYPNLIRIGITGSYGKTTVKELTAQMLSHKFNVIKTPKNTNSDIGISRFILNTDFTDVDIFIVEMGAYVKGDLKLHCNIVHPTIGILTAINPQHLSMFGTIEEIQNTKYDLLRCLPKEGLAVVNNDNTYCREYISQIHAEVMTFGTDETYNPTLLLKNVRKNKDGLLCTGVLQWRNKLYKGDAQTQLIGEHMVMNLAPAVLVAHYLGFTRDEVKKAMAQLHNPENTLHVYHYDRAVIIDDSYNSNPDGFRAALQMFNQYPSDKKRIVITRGMLELGDESDELHEQIGGEIAFVADELIIITPDFVEPLKRGVVDKYHTKVYIKTDPKDLVEYIEQYKNQEVVILLENRIPTILRKAIEKHKREIGK